MTETAVRLVGGWWWWRCSACGLEISAPRDLGAAWPQLAVDVHLARHAEPRRAA